jgi:histone-lysine N-methyltransferase SETD7
VCCFDQFPSTSVAFLMSSRRASRSRAARSAPEPAAPASAAPAAASNAKQGRKRGREERKEEEEEEEEEQEEEEEEGEDEEADEDDDDDSPDEGSLLFTGTKTSKGEWLSGTLTYSVTSRMHYEGSFNKGLKHGPGSLFFPDGSSLVGSFIDDEISGLATYTGADGSKIIGKYTEGGVLNGEVVEQDEEGKETFRGEYVDSVRHGPGCVTLPDGGKLVGEFVEGVFHGKDNKYVYPPALDQEASLRGKWEDGVMKEARFYLGSSLQQPKVKYTFDESTATRISSHPMLPDPYEQLCVYVKQSSTPNSGEGLFALRDLPANTIVTWYSGTRDKGYKAERRKWSENSNTISLIDDDPKGEDIDIDVSEAWSSTSKYCASLAHKCNHSFDPKKQNAKYDMALHPRFSLIKSIRTLRAVPKDEELFVDYGYSLKIDPKTKKVKGKAGPDWYREAYAKYHELETKETQTAKAASTSAPATKDSKRPTKRAKQAK